MTAAPDWYRAALAARPEVATERAAGVSTAVRIWGPEGGVPVVLIHGGAAHAAWWDHIGPLLEGCRVVALDLSGHGDSGWRDSYAIAHWRDEVLAVVRGSHVHGRPILIAHSMGGLIAYAVMRDHADEVDGAVIVDSSFPRRAGGDSWRARHGLQRKIYPDRRTILDRFRLMPPSEPRSPFVVSHVASESVVDVDSGWSWKFDPKVFLHDAVFFEDVAPITDRRVALVVGDQGMLEQDEAIELAERLGAVGVHTLADCGHHVPLDRPLELVDIIQSFVRERSRRSRRAKPRHTTIGGS